MSLLDTIDLDALRAPLAEDAPSGTSLDQQGDTRTRWRKVTDAFREARQIERKAAQGVVGQLSSSGEVVSSDPPAKFSDAIAHWRTVAGESLGLLTTMSRDLRAAQYLIMALVRTDGFAGLAGGCEVARALVESQWATLGPRPEPDEPTESPEQFRAQPLVDLAGGEQGGLLEEPLRQVPLLDGCAWGQFGLVILPGGSPPSGDQAAEFGSLRGGTTRDFFARLFADTGTAADAWQKLADAVDKAAEGRVSLPIGTIVTILHDCRAAIESLAGETFSAESADGGAEDGREGGPTEGIADAARGGLATKTRTRDDVLRSLEEAASFFQRQDPHSLVAAQLRNIVRMARLPQVDYFRELIRDKQALEQLSRLVGLDFGDSAESGSGS